MVSKLTIINALTSPEFQILSEVTYTVTKCAFKISIALLLLRLTQKRRFVYILQFSIAFTTLYSIICFFLTLFQCQPASYAWDKLKIGGTCFSTSQLGGIAYEFSAPAIATDWLSAILPVFMLMTVVEPGIGTLAASAATLRPILQYFKFTGLSDSGGSGCGAWPRSHSSWHQLSRIQEAPVKALVAQVVQIELGPARRLSPQAGSRGPIR
jgi:hypothetical protein